jgi:hypothetical protein
MVEETKWDSKDKHFRHEKIHYLSPNQAKQFLGFAPTTLGEHRVIMWLFLPTAIYNEDPYQSPLDLFKDNKNFVSPYALQTVRYFPTKNLDVYEQALQFPSAFQNIE